MKMPLIALSFAAYALFSTPASAQKVVFDFDEHLDFTQLKTYAIDESRSPASHESASPYETPFIRERTNAAIAAQLEARGLTRDDVHPDVRVTTRRTFKTEQVVYPPVIWGYDYPYSWGWGYPYGWGLGYPHGWGFGVGYGHGVPGYTEEITFGTLTIDIVDATNGDLLWRGIGTKEVRPTSKPAKRVKRVVREVASILEHFPPGSAAMTTTDN